MQKTSSALVNIRGVVDNVGNLFIHSDQNKEMHISLLCFSCLSNIIFWSWSCPLCHTEPDCSSKKVKASAYNHLQMLYDVGPTLYTHTQTHTATHMHTHTRRGMYPGHVTHSLTDSPLFSDTCKLLLPFCFKLSICCWFVIVYKRNAPHLTLSTNVSLLQFLQIDITFSPEYIPF